MRSKLSNENLRLLKELLYAIRVLTTEAQIRNITATKNIRKISSEIRNKITPPTSVSRDLPKILVLKVFKGEFISCIS